MSARLEIDALRALRAIAKYGGVTRAAEHLGLSQSAVSHKIKRLEYALDCQLLTRRAGGPLFTDAGLRLDEYARRITDMHDEALADLGRKALHGSIRLGMTEDIATSDVARILGRFTRTCPSVSVRTRTGQSLNVQAWMNEGQLDLAVVQVFQEDVLPTDQILFHDRLHWVKSPDLRLDLSQPVPFLSFDENCFYRKWGFGERQVSEHSLVKVLECPSAAGIQSAVRSGLGVALLNGMHVTSDIEIIDGLFPPPPDIAYVVRSAPNQKSGPVMALVSEIVREYQRVGSVDRNSHAGSHL